MGRLVSIDGVLCAPEEARVSVYDRGFLYGDSVFETIRTYAGKPFALGEHMARLGRSASLVAIPMPIDEASFAREIEEAIGRAGNPESYVRAMLTRGSGPVGLDPTCATAPLRVVLVEPLVLLAPELYATGVAVITVRTERAADAAHGAKVGNYLASLLALRKAKEAGAHEALVVAAGGEVIEGTTSNVFAVQKGALVTPPERSGILPGITRAHVLSVAEQEGVPVRLEPLSPEDIATADEAFLSSSLRELLAVVRIDGRTIGAGVPGPVTQRLHAAFRRSVGLATVR